VGGCVRDTVMGVTPNDWDFATDAHTDEIIRVFFRKRVPRYSYRC